MPVLHSVCICNCETRLILGYAFLRPHHTLLLGRYIEYEEKLEALRLHRKEERGMIGGKHTLAEWAIPRRIHFIYDRALRRFKGDLDLWSRWLSHCRSAKSPRQMSKA